MASSFLGSVVDELLDDEPGAIVLLLDDELGAMVLLLDDELGLVEVSGALVVLLELEALGAGAVGAGDVVDVLEELDAGLVAGGVVTVVDFCSVHALTASVRAAVARSALYMLGSLCRIVVVTARG